MKSFSSRVAQSRMRMLQTHRTYSISSALNLFFAPLLFFPQISTGYELDSEKSVKCRQWWKRHLESVREMLYRQACGEHKHCSESSNHSDLRFAKLLAVFANRFSYKGRQTWPVHMQYICFKNEKWKIKPRFHWLYISARGKIIMWFSCTYLSF